MKTLGSAALENVVIERDMPKGYTWVKVRNCWTSDLSEGRFLSQKTDSISGEMLPAAFFGSVVACDPTSGYHERAVKFQGSDAILIAKHQECRNIVRLNIEGHLVTRAYDGPRGQVVVSTIFCKEGSLQILEVCSQSPREPEALILESVANEGMKELVFSGSECGQQASSVRDADMDASIWPDLESGSEDEVESMDNCPF